MIEYRSVSQVLFGFLPEQTVDMKGRVWKVKDWLFIKRNDIDLESIRKSIIRQASPWEASGMAGDFVTNLRKGYSITVVTIDEDNGVKIEPFPSKSWVCRNCFRVHNEPDTSCQCGVDVGKTNLYFVGFHNECGAIREPYIPRCKEHNQVRVNFPGTSSAAEIVFDCPVCNKILRKGFGNVKCECGKGNLKFLPHRASSVYTPQSVVIVNPPDKEKIRVLNEAGGPPRALSWVLNGMGEKNIEHVKSSAESLRRTLLSQGIDENDVEKMLEAVSTSSAPDSTSEFQLSRELQEEAESQAVVLALATLESRVQIKDLSAAVSSDLTFSWLYNEHYSDSLAKAGLKTVELIDKFPIITAQFGYTRGGHKPGEDKLTPFKSKGSKGYTVYADLALTEALFIQLDPKKVIQWLKLKGFRITQSENEKLQRESILAAIDSSQVNELEQPLIEVLATLIHSYAHRFIRVASVYSGIDRNGLSELLIPYHLGFFAYGAAKGDFVLGGLQAVFETELHSLLNAIVFEDHRCAMDPACGDSGGACMGCLHLGEPSCRHFNLQLSRHTLFGPEGYLNLST